MKALREKLTYANVMSTIAVFLVLGGATAFAAKQLGKNTVGTKQLKRNAVTKVKIKKNAVTGAKVRNRSLRKVDFAAGQLPTGSTGPAGAMGQTGPTGPTGVVSTTIVRRIDHVLADGAVTASNEGNIACEPGEKPISGGANFATINHGDARITGSGPRVGTVESPIVPSTGEEWTLWRATGINPAGGDPEPVTLRVYIICAPAP